jgi:hypothetical protein
MNRIFGDWLHWRIGWNIHFGYERFGNCWSFIPKIDRYPTVTFYSWWRFFFAIGKGRTFPS